MYIRKYRKEPWGMSKNGRSTLLDSPVTSTRLVRPML